MSHLNDNGEDVRDALDADAGGWAHDFPDTPVDLSRENRDVMQILMDAATVESGKMTAG